MKKINFEDLPSTNTPLSAENLNSIQSNIEDVFNGNESMGSIVVDDINCKNKFQILTQSLSTYGVTLTHNVDGSISIKGTSTSSSVYLTALKKIDVKDIDEGDYTISFKNDFIANAIAIRLRKVTGTTKSQIDELIYLDKKNKSKVLNLKSLIDSNTENIEMDIVLFSAMEYNYTIYPQIEKGSVATDYVQHKEYDNNLVQSNINELASKLNVITKNTGSGQSVTFNGSLTNRYIFMYMTILNGGTGIAGIFTINNGEVVSNSKILDNSTTDTVSITASTTGFTLTFSRNYSSCTVISPNIALN